MSQHDPRDPNAVSSANSANSANTVLIVTDDEFLRARERRRVVEAAHLRHGQVSVSEVAGEGLSVAEVHQGLTADLFGGVPVLVVTEAKKAAQPVLRVLRDWCASGTDEAVLVLEWARGGAESAQQVGLKALTQAGAQVVEVQAPKGAERRRFAAAELRAAGLSADGEADAVLAEGEVDLRGIAMRASQLASDLGAQPGTRVRVSAEQVAQVVSSPAAAGGFAVADALVARNARALAAALSTAQQTGTPNVLIVAACLSGLRNVALVGSGSVGKMPPWKVAKAQRSARVWTASGLARAVAEVGGAHPAVGSSGRRDSDLVAALLRAVHA